MMAKKNAAQLTAMIEKLEAQRDGLNEEIKNRKKALTVQKRQERTHHICERGGELTHLLDDKTEILTDDDVKYFLAQVFQDEKYSGMAAKMVKARTEDADTTMEELMNPKVQVPIEQLKMDTEA